MSTIDNTDLRACLRNSQENTKEAHDENSTETEIYNPLGTN